MTSLAAAVAVDSRGPSALYVITDSRITWGSASERWDWGRKTFASSTSPDIFGYCGDAYFTPMALSQVLDLTALNVIRLSQISADERHSNFLELLKNAIAASATQHMEDITVFHGSRDGEFMESRFRLWRTHMERASRVWKDEELQLTESASYLALLDGSGASHVERYALAGSASKAAGTSRAAMYSFTKSLRSGADPFSGGAPQLVGLWRKGLARQFGFCWNGQSYIAGMQVPSTADHSKVDWFNHLFERCDGRTGSKLPKAKSHRASLAPRT
jgi:hypothetical protein